MLISCRDVPHVRCSNFLISRAAQSHLVLFMFLIIFLQVDNAATKGASAVLIYPDSQDYKYQADTALYGHVSLHISFFFFFFTVMI